ncbi:LysM peptidoglycan-binding domain-containing protein [Inmirania thermothiophila]|uniref:LysM domain-containing protein n=1 Tax=Inmirania thermothiophila TaxID=1750597 RepID=A0A3N1Y620_9GAMM|nr:LysM peptidoglycan-binding domain-containing protein [Inmirania thermothiophila]ROR34254.1 LysM domain-containing protein [Inmirania thermothiophila]
MHARILSWILALLAAGAAAAAGDAVALRDGHPERYVVRRGDTLWDIASRFLRDPWRWPDIWHINPQIANPHLIYPGDEILLSFDAEGRPQLTVRRGRPTVKLSPRVRATPLREAIPPIPFEAVRQFLDESRVVLSREELERAPYIVESLDGHLVNGSGNRIYVRSIPPTDRLRYGVYRPGRTFTDPDTGEILGHEALFVGTAALQRVGDPATLVLTHTVREALIGDRLLPVGEERSADTFYPHAPPRGTRGRIIAVVDGVSQIGQYQVVVLDLGRTDGIEAGHVLAVHRAGGTVRDVVSPEPRETVRLPDERSGLVMVFRPFERVSYALVMEAERPIHVLDPVTAP